MVLFQRRVYENVEPAFVYDIPKMHYYYNVLIELRFLSYRFPKEDSRCPTFLVVAGSRDLFHNIPLPTIPHRWVGLEIRTVPVVRRCDLLLLASPSQRVYSSRFTSLVGYLYSVNKRCDVQIVRWRGSLHLPADRPVCQNNMTHRPPRARSRAGLLCATLYNKWMNES